MQTNVRSRDCKPNQRIRQQRRTRDVPKQTVLCGQPFLQYLRCRPIREGSERWRIQCPAYREQEVLFRAAAVGRPQVEEDMIPRNFTRDLTWTLCQAALEKVIDSFDPYFACPTDEMQSIFLQRTGAERPVLRVLCRYLDMKTFLAGFVDANVRYMHQW